MAEDIELNYVLVVPNLNVNRVSGICARRDNNAIALKRAIVKNHPELGQVSDISVDVWKVGDLMLCTNRLLSVAPYLQLLRPLPQQEAYKVTRSIVPGQAIPNTYLLQSLDVMSEIFADHPPPQRVHLIVHVQVSPMVAELDAYQHAIREIDKVLGEYGIQQDASNVVTIHVEKLNTWTINDIRNPQNGITMLWESNPQTPNTTLDDIRSKLGKRRVPSDVCVLSSSPLVLLSCCAQALLCTHQYKLLIAVTDHESVFGASGGEGAEVSQSELEAFAQAVTVYTGRVKEVKELSSSMKDGWFTDALVAPPMLDVAADSQKLIQRYRFDWYVYQLNHCPALYLGDGTLTKPG
jgi:hypothetical protein